MAYICDCGEFIAGKIAGREHSCGGELCRRCGDEGGYAEGLCYVCYTYSH